MMHGIYFQQSHISQKLEMHQLIHREKLYLLQEMWVRRRVSPKQMILFPLKVLGLSQEIWQLQQEK
jgi:hypothetical protein